MDSFGVSHLGESLDVDKTGFFVSTNIRYMTTFSVCYTVSENGPDVSTERTFKSGIWTFL